MRRLLPILVFFCFSIAALAQSVGFSINGQVVNTDGVPVPYAPITVCLSTAMGVPCAPTTTIYSAPDLDSGSILPNPVSADQYGNYSIWVPQGPAYIVQPQASGTVVYSYSWGGIQPNRLSIGTVTSGNSAAATITGTVPYQVLNLTIPVNSLTIGTVSTLPPSSPATASVTGTAPNQTLNLGIPNGLTGSTGATGPTGATGSAATIAVGTTTTLSPGSSATVSNSGTSGAAVFNFGLPLPPLASPGPIGGTTPAPVTTTALTIYGCPGGEVALADGTGCKALSYQTVTSNTSGGPYTDGELNFYNSFTVTHHATPPYTIVGLNNTIPTLPGSASLTCIQYGTRSSSGGVTFSPAFSVTPKITLGNYGGSANIVNGSASGSGFTISGSGGEVDWIAMGPC